MIVKVDTYMMGVCWGFRPDGFKECELTPDEIATVVKAEKDFQDSQEIIENGIRKHKENKNGGVSK